MSDWLTTLTLLAQEGQKEGAPPGGGGGGIGQMLLMFGPLLLIILLFQFMFNPQKRERARVEQMTKSLKKNDRVVTIGGLIGTVAQVFPERGEVTLKVDDNTRLKFRLASIHEVLKDETTPASEPAKTP